MAVVLASTSAIRRAMLEAAGVDFTATAPGVDESAFKQDGGNVARRLADAKALAVSGPRPAELVIGSDSLVTVDGRHFDKPADRQQAADHLRLFSGKTMMLTSAVSIARGGQVEWRHHDTARLHVRTLSEDFITDYLDCEWPAVSYCVGVFRLEGRGVQLFDAIDGSHFTILGMPLLPLLGALRDRGVLL
jgi:septum formation protein